MSHKRTLVGSSLIPIRFVFFMWLFFALDFIYDSDLFLIGIIPRTTIGLFGIFTAPFIHADPIHLISNTVPFLFLGITLFYNYPRISKRVFSGCYFITNVLVWLFARQEQHVGASGLVYALATFIIAFGLFRRDFKSLLLSVIVIILYGSIYYGVIPTQGRVSWESHLFGSIVGLILASAFARKKRV